MTPMHRVGWAGFINTYSNGPEISLTLLYNVLAIMFRYNIMYLINFVLKPIQTKISVFSTLLLNFQGIIS